MKNPVEIIMKESKAVSELYHKLSKLRGKLDKEMHAIGKKFLKELSKVEKAPRLFSRWAVPTLRDWHSFRFAEFKKGEAKSWKRNPIILTE